jgi:hypothetical protein
MNLWFIEKTFPSPGGIYTCGQKETQYLVKTQYCVVVVFLESEIDHTPAGLKKIVSYYHYVDIVGEARKNILLYSV